MTETEEMMNSFEWCSTMPGCKGCPLEYKYACRFRLMQWAYKHMSAQQKAIATLKQKLFYQLQENEPNTVDELKKQEQWNYVKDGLPTTDDWMEVAILDEHGDTPFTYTSFGWYWKMAKGWIVDNDCRTDIYAWKPLSKAPEVVKGE